MEIRKNEFEGHGIMPSDGTVACGSLTPYPLKGGFRVAALGVRFVMTG